MTIHHRTPSEFAARRRNDPLGDDTIIHELKRAIRILYKANKELAEIADCNEQRIEELEYRLTSVEAALKGRVDTMAQENRQLKDLIVRLLLEAQ